MTDEVYSLCLSTSTSQSDKRNIPIYRTASNYADVSWLVNWDEIIPQEKISEYKFCRVRFTLLQGSSTYSWNTQLGYLCANFQSDFNIQTTCLPTILGVLYAQQSQNPNSSDQVYSLTTLDQCGVDININSLRGQQILQLKWCNDDSITPLSNISKDYEISLFFQLYN
jgi:hypothetical protein